MYPTRLFASSLAGFARGFSALLACVALASAIVAQSPTPAGTGSLAGNVSNLATKNMLQGARVDLPALGLTVFTDPTGSFTLANVPAGDQTIVVSYTGLDPVTESIAVPAGQRATRNFELTSSVYQMNTLVVAGEREGNAASITRQRLAPNVKNVVALDAFGNLPNDSAGELLIRLPGVAGRYDDEGNVTGVSIRGAAPGYNTVSVDGNQVASAGGFARDFRTHNISGALFDEIEVTKAPTPDMSADSLGGAVNFKTRSSLGMKEDRRISYRAGARWAPSFYDHTPMRLDHPVHPLLSGRYQEVFSVLGGERNLGVSFDAFYSENVNGGSQTLLDYQFTTASPAYVYDYRQQDAYNNRLQQSASLRVDYKLSDHTRVFVNTIYNDALEKFNRLYTFRAFTGRTLATVDANGNATGTGAILPGYTENRTQVRGVAASTFQLNSTLYSFFDRQRVITAGANQEFGALKLDYNLNYSRSRPVLASSYRDNAGGGIFTMDVTNVGWIFDKSASSTEPVFTQTEGPSIYTASNYKNGLLVNRNNQRNTTFKNASVDGTYALPANFRTTLKSGVRYRDTFIEEVGGDRRWNYVGTSLASLVDPSIRLTDSNRTGKQLPFVDSARVGTDIQQNPANWKEDLYYGESRKYIGTRSVAEDIGAAYLQGETKLGPVSVLAGSRVERTKVEGIGYVISKTPTTTAQQAIDPVGSARADYIGGRRVINGKYTDWFPGVYVTYKIVRNVQARASWSNGIGRPPGTNLVPSQTVSSTAETVTIANPSVKPQHAENWDATLEYYFEPVGQLSAGYFRKDVKDFLVSRTVGIVGSGADNGFGGDYSGYTLLSNSNGGAAKIEGWELNYQQQFTFLPGAFSGLGFFANYTKLTTSGDYGETGTRSTSDVAGFVPETINVGLTYDYQKFGARVLFNHNGSYLQDYSTDASRLRYRAERDLVNVSLTYKLHRELSLFVDLANIFNEPQDFYRYSESRLERSTFNGTTINAGISGRF